MLHGLSTGYVKRHFGFNLNLTRRLVLVGARLVVGELAVHLLREADLLLARRVRDGALVRAALLGLAGLATVSNHTPNINDPGLPIVILLVS